MLVITCIMHKTERGTNTGDIDSMQLYIQRPEASRSRQEQERAPTVQPSEPVCAACRFRIATPPACCERIQGLQ